jgi:hypothetical protein
MGEFADMAIEEEAERLMWRERVLKPSLRDRVIAVALLPILVPLFALSAIRDWANRR